MIQWLGLLASTAEGMCSTPGWETKISHVHSMAKKKKKKRQRILCLVFAQSCLTHCGPMDCSQPGFSVHGILQARIWEWVATSYSWGSSWPRDWTHDSCVSCTDKKILYHYHHLESPYEFWGDTNIQSYQEVWVPLDSYVPSFST